MCNKNIMWQKVYDNNKIIVVQLQGAAFVYIYKKE